MKKVVLSLSLVAAVAAISCVQQSPGSSSPASASAGSSLALQPSALALSATIDFGNGALGSDFPPVPPHDQSGHADDSLFPREVIIDKGGTVTFVMSGGVHQVAIYSPGKGPKDINENALTGSVSGCPPVPLINDSNQRLAVLSDQVCHGGSHAPSYQFNNPGRYLVICTFLPHFQVGMYGWVTVRDR